VLAVAGAGFLLPQTTLSRMGARRNINARGKEWLLNRALRIDDDVAEALYSRNRMVPTYTKSQITPIKNNYNGATPDPGYISGWNLTLNGLASCLSVSLNIRKLMNRFPMHEQITRLVCVEGWSAIAWWAGLRFDDLLRAYPPKSQAKRARVESSVNLDASGNPDSYFVSIDLATVRHPQNAARHTFQRSAPYSRTWSPTPSPGACKTWLEEREGHYPDYLFRGRAKRLLGSIWYSSYDGI
jgi:DMSO/TMAO reductase YedYZ molybdopterin-dependent catalytic subunit